eukprot:gene52914-biopygen63963
MWSRMAPRPAPRPLPLRWVSRGRAGSDCPAVMLSTQRAARLMREHGRRCYRCGAYGHTDRGALCPERTRLPCAAAPPRSADAAPPPPRASHQALPFRAADGEGLPAPRAAAPPPPGGAARRGGAATSRSCSAAAVNPPASRDGPCAPSPEAAAPWGGPATPACATYVPFASTSPCASCANCELSSPSPPHITPGRLRVPSDASLLRAGFVARRKFGIPAARFARIASRLFAHIADVHALRGDLPAPLRPRALLSNILSSQWDDDSEESPEPYTQARRMLFSSEAPWKPLKHVGACQLSTEELCCAFDPLRRNAFAGPPVPRPSPSPLSIPMRDFIHDMVSLRLLEELDPTRNPPTCRMSIIPKNSQKSRAICNARFLNQRQPHAPAHFRLPTVQMLKRLLLTGPLYFATLDVASCYQSMRLPSGDGPPLFIFHTRGADGALRAFRLLHLPFGWNASPILCQRRTQAAMEPPARRQGGWALIYLDDGLVFARDPTTTSRAGKASERGLRANHFVPHPSKTDLTPRTATTWIGKSIQSQPASIAPTLSAAQNALAYTTLRLCMPMSLHQRQRLTGNLVWAGSQHSLHLPFLQHVHRFRPRRPMRPPRSVVDSALKATVIAALPWTGQGFVDLPLEGRPRVFFDGVASPTRASAAVLVPPDFAVVAPLPQATDQQQAELDAAHLALTCAAHLGLQRPVVIGDSTSALGSLRRMSCPARLLHRGDTLRCMALCVIAAEMSFTSCVATADPGHTNNKGCACGLASHTADPAPPPHPGPASLSTDPAPLPSAGLASPPADPAPHHHFAKGRAERSCGAPARAPRTRATCAMPRPRALGASPATGRTRPRLPLLR